MTKLQLIVDSNTLHVVRCDKTTAKVFQCDTQPIKPIHVSEILSDEKEFQSFSSAINEVVIGKSSFQTLNLVFKAPQEEPLPSSPDPGATKINSCSDALLPADRTPIEGVFRSPIRAIHTCGILEISTFTHIQWLEESEEEDSNGIGRHLLEISAMEYSRKHRQDLLRQEFGSWLLEEHIEKAVIATTLMGEVCFWNRFACDLYQYSRDEVIGRNIMELTPSEMTKEQGMEIMGKLMAGEHWKGMFRVKRKDQSNFIAHVTDTPILDEAGNVKFIVGVSADYTPVHDLMDELQELNTNLEQQVQKRTEQLLEKENYLRLVGAAVKASDTGVLITNQKNKIVWSNDAISHLLLGNSSSNSGIIQDDDIKMMEICEPSNHRRRPQDQRVVLASLQEQYPWDIECLKNNTKFQEFLKDAIAVTVNSRKTSSTGAGDEETSTNSCVELDVRGALPVDYISVHVEVLQVEDGQHMDNSHHDSDETLLQHHMITIRDVSAQRQAEEAQLAAKLASEASKVKTEMMQTLSHELRSPLQGIMGVSSTMLEDLKKTDEDEGNERYARQSAIHLKNDISNSNFELQDNISTILASSRLLLTLINNVLDIRKIESNMMQEIQLGPVSIMECMENAKLFCSPFAAQQDVKLRLQLSSDSSSSKYAMANRLRVEQILINLITNGIKYTKPGSEIVMKILSTTAQEALQEALDAPASDAKRLAKDEQEKLGQVSSSSKSNIQAPSGVEGKAIIISIRDRGSGIPKHEFGKVFGEFSQLTNSEVIEGDKSGDASKKCHKDSAAMTAQPSGTGLGLNLVMKFVSAMKGHVWVTNCEKSDRDKIDPFGEYGAEFHVSLPETAAPISRKFDVSSLGNRPIKLRKKDTSKSPGASSGDEPVSQRQWSSSLHPIADYGSSFRVLVVDDSLINIKVIVKMLSRLGVKQVETAIRGSLALDYLTKCLKEASSCDNDDSGMSSASSLPNLIISDISMPEMDGYELVGHINKLELPNKPTTMAWTANCSLEVEQLSKDAGFDGMIGKPVTVRDLEEVLTRLVMHDENPQS